MNEETLNEISEEEVVMETIEEDIKIDPTDEIKKELEETKDKWIRSVAELENVRRRSQKEREDALKFGSSTFAKNMLGVVDNIHRAQETIPEDIPENLNGMRDGINMIEKEILSIFEKQGIKEISVSSGDSFDSNFHQAIMESAHESIESGKIIQVIQNGYTMHERLLRPSMVIVSKGSE
jgi:molecular chaperone GrpE